MSIGKQNGGAILAEYAMDNLGVSFKVVLVNSVQRHTGEKGEETFIPDFQGLMKRIAITRAANPLKLKGGDIKFLRKTLGLRAKELAEKLDIVPEHLSRCESGEKTLSANSEKVLRSLILLEAVYVLRKAIEDRGDKTDHLREKVLALIDSLRDIMSEFKIVPVSDAQKDLVLYFELKRHEPKSVANDAGEGEPEWLDQAA